MKKALFILGGILLALIVIAGGFLVWLTVTEYRPDDVEPVEALSLGGGTEPSREMTVLSWNIGYCGLGRNADFVMDGGSSNGSPSREDFLTYLGGVTDVLRRQGADVYMLQEVDSDSSRSYGTNESELLPSELGAASSAYALNYSCGFVPFPWPPIGRVNSGLLTVSNFAMEPEGERIALPCPFSWPLRVANLKRCMLVTRVSLPDTDAQLVIVNLHLEAYDSGEGKAAQTAMLMDYIEQEYEKGNYVLAGGDFNQTFPGGLAAYPIMAEGLWVPGELAESSLPEGFSFACDSSSPSCRSLDRPLDITDPSFQYYLIDGFILSPNLSLSRIETIDLGFEYSDHNPVKLTIALKGADE